jgi:hypothetical protein
MPICFLIRVSVNLREHAVAHAARVLRQSGATPAQTKVGIALALGKTKPMIAKELGVKPSSIRGFDKKTLLPAGHSQCRSARQKNMDGSGARSIKRLPSHFIHDVWRICWTAAKR